MSDPLYAGTSLRGLSSFVDSDRDLLFGRDADRDQLERGLRRLSDAQRTILILIFYVGLSPTEAAGVLDIPVGTAKSRMHYALDALRAALAADERAVGDLREGRTA